MTDNLPATRTDDQLATVEPPVSRADTDSWALVIAETARLADYIAATEFVPRDLRGKPAAVAAAILYGREIGLPPMTALTQTHVIEGKPAASAEAMRALFLAAGHEIRLVESTGSICTMEARRRGSQEWTRLSWTIDQAKAARLTGKDNWQKYPRAMLQARCSAELVRIVGPDVVLGMRALEEFDEAPPVAEIAETPVARKAVTARKTASRPTRKAVAATPPPTSAPVNPPAESDGMPLPGEDGYDDGTGPSSAGVPTPPADEPAPYDASRDIDHVPPPPQSDPVPDGGTTSSDELTDYTPPADEEPPVEDVPDEEPPAPPRPVTRPQQRMMLARFNELGIDNDERDERLRISSAIVGRRLSSANDLNRDEAQTLIDTLVRVPDLGTLLELVDLNSATREE